MSFSNPSELFLLARICFLRLMLFSVSACLVFVASRERKIGLLPSMAIHISVTTCDACAADQVVRFTRPSPSIFAYCKQSKTGAEEGLGMWLMLYAWADQRHQQCFSRQCPTLAKLNIVLSNVAREGGMRNQRMSTVSIEKKEKQVTSHWIIPQ